MWWLIVGGLVAWGIAESEAEKKARKEFERTRTQHSNMMNAHRREIRRFASHKSKSFEFHKLRELHWESHKINQLARKTYFDGKKSYSGVCRMINSAISKRREFVSELAKAKKSNDTGKIIEIKGNLRILNQHIDKLFEEKEKLADQKDSFYNDMISLQQATTELKYQIRDNCGPGGEIWFDRIEARNESRRRSLG